MASNDQNIGGYDCKFVVDPPDALKCLICLSVTKDPQQHGQCGKLFCNSCITEHRKISNNCPHCRRILVTFEDGRSEYYYIHMITLQTTGSYFTLATLL